MGRHGTQSFLQGALILAVSALVVKVIGAFFKVPLTNILGGTGMGYFMTAYDLFNPIRSLAIAGIPIAVSKMVSEGVARGRYADVRRVFRTALLIVTVTGLLGSLLLYHMGGQFARAVGNPAAELAVLSMAPAIFFCCVISAYRGYFEGLQNMYPTAVSQVVEAVVKLVCGIGFAKAALERGYLEFARESTVFGYYAASSEQAEQLLAPITAAAAVWGIGISTLAALLLMLLRYALFGSGLEPAAIAASPHPRSYRALAGEMVSIAVPVCLGSLTVNIGSMVDLFSVMNRLGTAIESDPAYFAQLYRPVLDSGVTLTQLPGYLYGSYTGLALTVFNIVPALTVVFGVSALPAVSSAWAVRDRRRTQQSVQGVLQIVSMLAIPAGLGISAMSMPILKLLFGDRPLEVAVAAPLLQVLGFAVIFVSITTPVNSMLQAVGRMDLPVKLMAVGALLKAAINLVFVGRPTCGIGAAPYGTLVCYGFIVVSSVFLLCRETGIRISVYRTFFKPLFAGAACAITARTAWILLSGLLGEQLCTLLSIGIGAIIYFFLVFFLQIVTKDDVLQLRQGKK